MPYALISLTMPRLVLRRLNCYTPLLSQLSTYAIFSLSSISFYSPLTPNYRSIFRMTPFARYVDAMRLIIEYALILRTRGALAASTNTIAAFRRKHCKVIRHLWMLKFAPRVVG